jgi:hypothetical protein
MNPPSNGQYIRKTYTSQPRSRRGAGCRGSDLRSPQACSATCSLGEGKAQATCSRRS